MTCLLAGLYRLVLHVSVFSQLTSLKLSEDVFRLHARSIHCFDYPTTFLTWKGPGLIHHFVDRLPLERGRPSDLWQAKEVAKRAA